MALDPTLQALAAPPDAESAGPAPLSPAPLSPEDDTAPQETDLGDLAFGFLNATDPESASAYLLEFLEEAGFSRSRPKD